VDLRPPLIALATALLAGCGSPAPGGPEPDVVADPVMIVYDSYGCYGTCPIYRVEVRPDGSGVFVGSHHVRVIGARRLRLSPDRYRRFAAFLEPLRPPRGSLPPEGIECNPGDGPSWAVEWVGRDGARQSLCIGGHDALPDSRLAHERIPNAGRLLPIEELVGPVE
jgi:hypothetical protein